MKREPKIEHCTVWSDQHMPFHDQDAHSALYAFVKDWQPDYHVHIGDCLDLGGIGHHVENDYVAQYEEPVEEGLLALGKHFNTLFDITPNAKIIWISGNHEDRLNRFVKKNPAWRGLLDKPLRLVKAFGDCPNAHRIKFVELNDFTDDFQIGRMSFCHGFSTTKHAACKHVEMYEESVTFGHCHTMQMFGTHRKVPRMGYCVGHLTDERARRYLKGAPARWITGFGHMQYFPSNGLYTMNPIPIVENGFFWGDKYYHKSQWNGTKK